MHLIRNMNFIISHILREWNHCADKMTKSRFNVQTLTWWDEVPLEVMSDFARNRLRLPNFRYAYFEGFWYNPLLPFVYLLL